jgi:zinc protease
VQLQHPDLYALDLLATIIGGSDNATLDETIRDQQQLVSQISAYDETPSYVAGTFGVDLQCDPEKVPAATKAVLDELEKLKTTPIDPQRIARAKTLTRMQHVQGLQTSDGVAGEMATDYFQTGDAHFGDRYVDRIDAVTAAQLQDVARRYLDQSRLLTTAMIPSEAAGASDLPSAVDLMRPAASSSQSVASTQRSDQSITRVVLPNNIVLLHKYVATTPLVSIKMYAPGGVSAEDQSNNGIGNLAMSLISRGTTTQSAEQLADQLESMGASISADCGNNTWHWDGTCLSGDLDKTMSLFADEVNNPAFSDDETAGMKQRVLADIGSQDSDWTDQAMHFFKQSYFGPLNSPHQFLPIGSSANVQKFTPADLKKWYHDKVLAGPRVLAIFGDVPLEKAQSLATQYLGGGAALPPIETIHAQLPPTTQPTDAPASLQVERVQVQKTEQPLAGIVIGFDASSVITSPDEPVLDIADCLTSGYSGGSGYLYDVLRGKGLVYVVQTENVPGVTPAAPGTFIAYAGCDPGKVNEVVDLILENMARLQGSPADIQTDWFDRSKQLIITSDALDNETPDAQASTAALDELYGLGYQWHAGFADRIKSVTLDQVRTEARAALNKCVITICTPAPELVTEKAGERDYATFPHIDLTPRGVQHAMGVGEGK